MSMHQSNQGCLDGLPSLPTELLILIGEHLPNHDLNRFIRVNRRIYGVLIDLLCRRNIQHQRSSALPWAVRKNHVEVVCRLLRLGADVNTLDKGSYQRVNSAPSQEIDRTGFSRSEWTVTTYDPLLYHEVTSLFIAVWTRNLRLVKILLKAGARVNSLAHTTFQAELGVAIRRADIPMSRVLVNALEDINACLLPGWTAVALASNYRQVEILRHLLQKGAIPIVTNRVFTGLLVVDDLRRKRLQRFLKGDLDDLNEIVYRHRIDDAPLEILRLLMHHGFKPSEEQRRQGQMHSDPRVRYLFHDPQTNKGVKRTGKDHDTDAAVSQETLEDDFPPICPDKEASVVTENSVWNDAKMHELKRSFAPGSKPSLDLTMRHPFSKIDVLSEKHIFAGEHTHAENRTPATSDPFPPLRPVPHENENALESKNHVPIKMEAENAHEDPLNNWKTFRENITAPETSHKSSKPTMSNDKRKKKKGKWTALEL